MAYTDLNDPMNVGEKEAKIQFDKISLVDASEIPYVPLLFSIERDKVKSGEELYGISSILKPLLSKISQSKITDIEIFEGLLYSFNPINEFGISVYINPKYFESIYSQVDLERLVGYTLLSTNSLSKYIAEKEGFEVKHVENIAIVPLDFAHFQDFEFTLNNYIRKGLFAYEFSPFDSDDYEVVKQICKMFDIEIVNKKNVFSWILLTHVDFTISPEVWIRNNIPLVKMGKFPAFTLHLEAVAKSEYQNDYNRQHGELYTKYRIKYFALMVFAQLSDKYPEIKPFIYNLRINADYSVTLNLPSISLTPEFSNIFDSIYDNANVLLAKDLNEAIIKKYIISNVDSDSYPIIFSDEGKTQQIIIHRSPLASSYPSPFDFSAQNMMKSAKELEDKMRIFYQTCHDNLEPVSLEEINNMRLEDLLHLIPITENNVTYCFSKETIEKVDSNPLTRTPLSEETKQKFEKLEYGLRGYFDVGVLFGLYSAEEGEEIADYSKFGLTQVVRIPVEAEYRDLYGNLFLVKVLFSDGTESDLFEISLPTVNLEKIDELKNAVDKLWNTGFFLNPWQKFLLSSDQHEEKNFFVFVNKEILMHAKDSIYDGDKALNYLNSQL